VSSSMSQGGRTLPPVSSSMSQGGRTLPPVSSSMSQGGRTLPPVSSSMSQGGRTLPPMSSSMSQGGRTLPPMSSSMSQGSMSRYPSPSMSQGGRTLPLVFSSMESPTIPGSEGRPPLPQGSQGRLPLPQGSQGRLPLPQGSQGRLPLPQGSQGRLPLPQGSQGRLPLPQGSQGRLPRFSEEEGGSMSKSKLPSLASPGSPRFSLSSDRVESGEGVMRITNGNMRDGYSSNSRSFANERPMDRPKLPGFSQIDSPALDMPYSQFNTSDPEVMRLLADLPTKDLEFNMGRTGGVPLKSMEMKKDIASMPTFVGNMPTRDLEYNFNVFSKEGRSPSPPRSSLPSFKSSGQPGSIRTMASTMIPGLSTPVPDIRNIERLNKDDLMKLIKKSSKMEREKTKLNLTKSLKRAAEIELEDAEGSEYILAKATYDKLSGEFDQISSTLLSMATNNASIIENQNLEYARGLYEDKYGKIEEELRGHPITIRFVVDGKKAIDIKTFDNLHLSSAVDALRRTIGKDVVLRKDFAKKYSVSKTLKENGIGNKQLIHIQTDM
jgi:hypothetical protein